jgi:hypothetical protein
MNQLEQWFFERTGFYPSLMAKHYLKKAFLQGYLIAIVRNDHNNQAFIFARTPENKFEILPL